MSLIRRLRLWLAVKLLGKRIALIANVTFCGGITMPPQDVLVIGCTFNQPEELMPGDVPILLSPKTTER